MSTSKPSPTKPLRRRASIAGEKLTVRFPKGLTAEIKAMLPNVGMRQNDWLVQAVRSALLAQAEERSFGRLTEISNKMETVSTDVGSVKKRVEALHETVRGIENTQSEELGQAFSKIGDAFDALNARLKAIEGVIQGQRITSAAMLMGGNVEQRNQMRRILVDPDRLGQLITDWLG